ncbi:MAG: isoprenylcysteine carboxylmethyltransferase family protein [Planctomycetota bacterium]
MPILLISLIAVTAVQRLCELRLSQKNLRTLQVQTKSKGGVLWPGEKSLWFGALVFVQISLLIAPLVEAYFLPRAIPLLQSFAAMALWLSGQALRLWSQKSLGPMWNARGIVSSTQTVVFTGPYRHLRHPNYFGVLLEMIAIPLAGSAWFSLIVLNLALLPLLNHRIRGEERLLSRLNHFSKLPGSPVRK